MENMSFALPYEEMIVCQSALISRRPLVSEKDLNPEELSNGIWEDMETRDFYEAIKDIRAVMPSAVFEDAQKQAGDAALPENGKPSLGGSAACASHLPTSSLVFAVSLQTHTVTPSFYFFFASCGRTRWGRAGRNHARP
jgi:hypothetical protein